MISTDGGCADQELGHGEARSCTALQTAKGGAGEVHGGAWTDCGRANDQREQWLRAEALAAHTRLAQWRLVQSLPRA